MSRRVAVLALIGHALGPAAAAPAQAEGMILVDAGAFWMGRDDGEPDEAPRHRVFVKDFWIDRHKVTNAEVAAFLDARGTRSDDGERRFDDDDADARIHRVGGRFRPDAGYEGHPAVEVSWFGARDYCAWKGRRLPTEAEWEKAARGDDSRPYPWGWAPPTPARAIFGRPFNATAPTQGRPDGRSPYGVEDLLGNLREWTATALHSYPYGSDDGRERFGGRGRVVLRGASHDDPAEALSVTRRHSYDRRGAGAGHHHVGFRCATSEDPGGTPTMRVPIDNLVMNYPLTITHFFERARRLFAGKTLGTRVPGVGLVKSTYADFAERTARLAGALQSLGIGKGDRVGTFAWNSHRHLEVYFAAPMMGAVLHTVNIRLSPHDITYIVNHADDRVLIVDASTWPTLEPIRGQLRNVRHVIVMKDTPQAEIPPGTLDYEALLAEARPLPAWPRLEETAAAGMCYTSGTTGHPKGAVYTHRAIFLHSLASSMADVLGISERDVILHIVPMFHANAWCVPFAGVMNGATQLFGGPNPQPRDIVEIVHRERVTVVGAVPTVWIAVDGILESEPQWDISCIRCIPIGGSAAPRALIEKFDKKYGARMLHAWGMTEMTPLGTVCRLKAPMEALPDEERYAVRAKQGYPVVGVDLRIVDDEGREQPWDGRSMGEMQVRGPWVIRSYYDNPESADRFTADGWFKTGDVATVDAEGYVQITDRTKDLIKSGGEWISSIDVEVLIMSHPKVLEAAVIAVPHPRWVERPLACVVPRPGVTVDAEEILAWLQPRLAKWAVPDAVVFIESVPKTSVGKFDKKVLRERFKDWRP